MRRSLLAISAALVVSGCGGPDNSWSVSTVISPSAHPFAGPWPFTVDKATITCRGESQILTLEVGGKTYGLNEAARDRGAASPAPVTLPGASLTNVVKWGEGFCAIGEPGGG